MNLKLVLLGIVAIAGIMSFLVTSPDDAKSESESIVKIVKTPKLKQNPTIMYGCIIICIFLFVILPIMTHIVKLKQENNDSLVINDV